MTFEFLFGRLMSKTVKTYMLVITSHFFTNSKYDFYDKSSVGLNEFANCLNGN